jgi:hypothetical protein
VFGGGVLVWLGGRDDPTTRVVTEPTSPTIPAADLPATARELLTDRPDAAVVQIDRTRVVVFGGISSNDHEFVIHNSGLLYDVATGTTEPIVGPDLDVDGLTRLEATVWGAKVVFAGMRCNGGEYVPDDGDRVDPCVDQPVSTITYDPTASTWGPLHTATGDAAITIRGIGSIDVIDDTVFIDTAATGSDLISLIQFDVKAESFRLTPRTARPLRQHCATNDLVVGLVYDSPDSDTADAPAMVVFDPAIGRWTDKGPWPAEQSNRQSYSLFCGGSVVATKVFPDFDQRLQYQFDPHSGSWTAIPPQPTSYAGKYLVTTDDTLIAWGDIIPKGDVGQDAIIGIDLGVDSLRAWTTRGNLPTAPQAWGVPSGPHPDGSIIAISLPDYDFYLLQVAS